YGYAHPERIVEVVTLRTRAVIPSRHRVGLRVARGAGDRSWAPVWFNGRQLKAPVVQRENVQESLQGPAVITEYSATTVVPPGWRATVKSTGDLVLGKSERRPFRSARWT
ncbi:MAG TPA: hypothetical protein VF135_01240, partial [Terriglobales bacterium]